MLGNSLRKLFHAPGLDGLARSTSTDRWATGAVMSKLSDRPENAVVGVTMEHESAALHVTGHALYTDDLVGRSQHVLHAHPVQAPHAHARITRLDASAAYDVPGVVRVLTEARRPRCQRRRHQARRAAVPRRGEVPRPRRLLGARRDARGRATRRPGGRGRLRAAARDPDGGRGDRGESYQGMQPVLERGDAATGLAESRPRLRGRDRLRRPGALLPRDPLLAGDGRRERPGVRAVQHPAPDRDPGDHRPRARRAEPPGDGAVPADGRRLRRQGDAAARARRGGRPRCHAHRSPGALAADPPAGHDDDRQASWLPRELAGRVRRRRRASSRSRRR